MSINLLIHNVGYVISTIFDVVAIFFLLLNNRKARGHTTFVLTLFAVAIFITSHIIGVNETDPDLSRTILMFNLSLFFIGIFNVHAVLALLKKDWERRYVITLLYAVGISIFIFFLSQPDAFLLSSVPKMYFPNYYNPGVLNWIRLVWLYGCAFYLICELLASARNTENIYEKKQFRFLALALGLGYVIGFIPNFLVYNIQIDPLWGNAFVVVFAIILIYTGLRYQLMNIKVVAKQAMTYALVIGSIGGIIILLEYLNRAIGTYYPKFPSTIIPFLSAALVVIITLVVWRKIREVDLLKYEFITTVTHKFRTPLTQIKWATENLSNNPTFSKDDKEQLSYIRTADVKLVELTNLLASISESEDSQYNYSFKKMDLSSTVDDVIASLQSTIQSKKVNIKKSYDTGVIAKYDEPRIKFVIQTFIENAVNYSQSGSTIIASITKNQDKVIFSVKDSGIGIAKAELPLIFSKFYRGNKARTSDTEGLGIGLYISKGILEKHKGTIQAVSEGENLGSTFSFTLPIK